MRKIILFSVSLIVGVFLTVWIYQHIGLKGVLLRFSDLLLWQMAALFILTFFKIIFWIIRWRIVLRTMGFGNLPFRKLAAARLGEFAVSYLTPGIYWGGEGVRIFVLKKFFNISLSKGVVSIILDRLFDIIGFCLFIFIGIIIFFLERNLNAVLFLAILVSLPVFLLFFIFKFPGLERILNFLIKIFRLEKLEYVRRNGENLRGIGHSVTVFFERPLSQLGPIMVFTALSFFASVCQVMLFLSFLRESCSLFSGMVMRILMVVAGFVPLPANLGVLEGTNTLVFQWFHSTAETGLSFSLLTRLIDFSFVILGILILFYYLGGHLFNKINGKNHSEPACK